MRKADISWLGTYKDAKTRSCPREDDATVHALMKHARNWVFKHGIPLGSKKIANLLDERSLVPTRVSLYVNLLVCVHILSQSAFSTRLSKFGFNVYAMLVPDLMHEHELGVWKAVLTHLLRILYAQGQGRIQELNRRYVLKPSMSFFCYQYFKGSGGHHHSAVIRYGNSTGMCLV